MTSELFVKIIGAVITIVVALISAYVVPYLKQKVTANDMETIKMYIQIAIRCADQIYTKEQWQEKKQFVFEYICKVVDEKLHIKLTPEDIDNLIEGLVNEIHENGVKE